MKLALESTKRRGVLIGNGKNTATLPEVVNVPLGTNPKLEQIIEAPPLREQRVTPLEPIREEAGLLKVEDTGLVEPSRFDR